MTETNANVIEITAIADSIKKLGTENFARRIALLNDRAKLETLAPKMAEGMGVPPEHALLIVDVAWECMLKELDQYEDNDDFLGQVSAAMVRVMSAFSINMPPEEEVDRRIYDSLLVRVQGGDKPQTIRDCIKAATAVQIS